MGHDTHTRRSKQELTIPDIIWAQVKAGLVASITLTHVKLVQEYHGRSKPGCLVAGFSSRWKL